MDKSVIMEGGERLLKVTRSHKRKAGRDLGC